MKRKFTVRATYCETFDTLDCEASSPEEARQMFHDKVAAEGHQPWHDDWVEVTDMTDRAHERTMYGGLPLWEKARYSHAGFYHYVF